MGLPADEGRGDKIAILASDQEMSWRLRTGNNKAVCGKGVYQRSCGQSSACGESNGDDTVSRMQGSIGDFVDPFQNGQRVARRIDFKHRATFRTSSTCPNDEACCRFVGRLDVGVVTIASLCRHFDVNHL